MHALGETFSGEPDAGNLEVRFDEGRVSRTTVLLSLLLYWLILHHFFFGELGTFWSDFASDQFFGEAFCKAETIS